MRILALLPLLILLLFIVGSLAALLGQLEVTTLSTLLRDAEIRFAFGLSLATALLSRGHWYASIYRVSVGLICYSIYRW